MSFATTIFIHWMSIIFSIRFTLIQFAQTFLSFVSIAYELAPGNFFWEHGLRGLEKKFRRLACTITRCALEHFLVGHWLLRAHFLHLAHRRRNGDWRGLYSLGGAVIAGRRRTLP
jgi:hypothetical protein